ncbi:site-2 protease family protein [Streptomyces sp. NPDC046977]|uniref:site-2 protease family protein n=1 Tax=Streptomyces sp. NPDC046977 TaxID=3154703 RepID=UPI0033D5CCEF
MNGSIRMGQVYGVPLRMHWSVPVLVVLLAYGLGRDTLPAWIPGLSAGVYTLAAAVGAVLLMASLLVHEIAHARTALRKHMSVQDVTLWAMGGMTRMDRPTSAGTAFLVAVSGPLASLVIGGVALGAGIGVAEAAHRSVPGALLVWLGWANLLLGVFNLLPAAPLDGGRVFQALLWWRTGDRDRADRAAGRGGQVVGVLLVLGGWLAFARGVPGGLWLALVGLFMALTAGAERQRAVIGSALRGVRLGDAMSSPVATGSDWLAVDRFIDEVALRSRHSVLPLLDFDGRLSGLVSVRRLTSVPAERRAEVRVRDVAVPLSQVTTGSPDELVSDALEHLRSGAAGVRVVVVDGGRPVGIVTGGDITRLVQRRQMASGSRAA